ncbi:CCR4-NOT core subunit cdc39 [Dimargaris verticillata]|uniref:General negative regulator of transcription subunit 1 n=1 Tax=Dimargaris verticillata TaxID=2761393 RepID=A0A9W8EDG3_9FUNG|nr:CCR4-NOT core subunit cdc39 [Dimargaris verticillata]
MDHRVDPPAASPVTQVLDHLTADNASRQLSTLFQLVTRTGYRGYIRVLQALFSIAFQPPTRPANPAAQPLARIVLEHQLKDALSLSFAPTLAAVFEGSASLFPDSEHFFLTHVPFSYLTQFVADDSLQSLALVLYFQRLTSSHLATEAAQFADANLGPLISAVAASPPSVNSSPARLGLLVHLVNRLIVTVPLDSTLAFDSLEKYIATTGPHFHLTPVDRAPTCSMASSSYPNPLLTFFDKEGPSCLATTETLTSVLKAAHSEYREWFTEKSLTTLLHAMANTGSGDYHLANAKSPDEWNGAVLGDVLRELDLKLDWGTIFVQFSHRDWDIPSAAGAQVLVACHLHATQESPGFPVAALCVRWANVGAQLRLLGVLLRQSDPVTWDLRRCRPVVRVADIPDHQVYLKNVTSVLTTSLWNAHGLLACLAELLNVSDFASLSKSILAVGLDQAPELVLLGFMQLDTPWPPFPQAVIAKLLPTFMAYQPTSTFVLSQAWQQSQSFVFATMLDLYKQDNVAILQLVDVAHRLHIEETLLGSRQFPFVLDFALYCARRDYLNLETWLVQQVREATAQFIPALLDFLRLKLALEAGRQEGNSVSKCLLLRPHELVVILNLLTSSYLTNEQMAYLKALYPSYTKLQSGILAAVEELSPTASEEAEKTAESYYLRLYKGDVTVVQLLDHLMQLRDSLEMRDNKVYSSVLMCLLDEFKFLPNYPDKELAIYSVFFGSVVARRLLTKDDLPLAVKILLEALNSNSSGRVFSFAMTALAQLKETLSVWPTACKVIDQVPNVRHSNTEVATFIHALATQLADPAMAANIPTDPYFVLDSVATTTGSLSSSAALPTSSDATPAHPQLPFNAVVVDTLTDNLVLEDPPEEVQDKLLFIMNNVAQNNLEAKVDEMNTVLDAPVYRWFSQNILVKRASNQPNYHTLYVQLLETIANRVLFRCVLHETFVNIRILLNSDKTVSDSNERSHLKNLGAWLGKLTLARNKPIKHTNIAFKELLIQGHDGGRLIVAIPFVCKVLEQASTSTVFKPPNPWLMAILRVLVELYKHAELKLNLKFEIEVLCRALGIELGDITPTTYLKDRPTKDSAGPVMLAVGGGSHDALDATHGLADGMQHLQVQPSGVGKEGSGSGKPLVPGQFAYVPPTLHTPNEISTNIAGLLAANVKFNATAALVNAQPAYKRLVLLTMEKMLRDVMPVQVARAVLIASTSTQDLVTKDYCMEPNEDKMRHAAHQMVRSVAGALAIAQCRKPLQDGLYSHLKEFLLQQGLPEAFSEQAAAAIVTENLELICAIVEVEAMDRSAREIDECLAPALLTRKRHRERNGQLYYDLPTYNSLSYPASMPAVLKVRPQGPQPQQQHIYDDFGNIPHFVNSPATQQPQPPPQHPQQQQQQQSLPGSHDHHHQSQMDSAALPSPAAAPLTVRQCLDKFSQYIAELDTLVSQTQINTFAELPLQHDIRLLMREVLLLVVRSVSRDDTVLDFSQRVVQLLYKNENNLAREVFVILLDKLCGLSVKASREVTHWLTYADDERKYNVAVTAALIKARLIDIVEQDRQLSKLMESGRTSVIEFTTRLVRKCVLDPQPIATQADLAASIAVLHKLAQRNRVPSMTIRLLEDLTRQSQTSSTLPTAEVDDATRQLYHATLVDWMRVYDHPDLTDRQCVTFVLQVQQRIQGAPLSPSALPTSHFASFVRVCSEMAHEYYQRVRAGSLPLNVNGSTTVAAYMALDALAKLLVLMAKYPLAKNGEAVSAVDEPQLQQLEMALTYTALALTVDHQSREQLFNQKPYFRFLVSVVDELRTHLHKCEAVYDRLMTHLAQTLQVLQPNYVPGFSFAWVSLIAHRFFMPWCLASESRWPLASKLLMGVLEFLAPSLCTGSFTTTTRLLYKGVVRIMLVILHDFPEFLCDYYTGFCDVIPPNCIQLRNLVVSAYARDLRLPEPLSPDLKLAELPEVQQDPRILSDYTHTLVAAASGDLKAMMDAQLQQQDLRSLVPQVVSQLQVEPSNTSYYLSSYNVPLLNALVLYLGVKALEAQRQAKDATTSKGKDRGKQVAAAVFAFYEELVSALPTSEGKYLLLNAMANQLRHPNSHTYYFSRTLLALFTNCALESVQEQITRVLIERAVVNRPLPWGLLVTLIDLMSNPECKFWDHSFTKVAPEITHILQSVSNSITSRA